jgi:nitrate/nitrite transporter NarK
MSSHKLPYAMQNWLVGIGLISLILGSLITWIVWKLLDNYFKNTAKNKNWELDSDDIEKITIQPILIGILERLVFSFLVAMEVSGVPTAIVGWMALKMASGWNRIVSGETKYKMLAFNGLIVSLLSLFFAVLGGLVANGSITF